MGYKNDFFGSSLNEEYIKNVSRWEIDRILNSVSAMNNKGNSKKHKISDDEIDKILSEKFVPIHKKELKNDENISDDSYRKSSDISVIKENRQENLSKRENTQDKTNKVHTNKKDMEKTQVINLNSDLKKEIADNAEKKSKEQAEPKIIEKNLHPARKNIRTPLKNRKKLSTSSLIMSILSFICLALCIMICLSLVAIR